MTIKEDPSKARFASPLRASELEKVATLLSAPLATAETAPPLPPPPTLDMSADTSMNCCRYQLVPSKVQVVISPDAVVIFALPPLRLVLVTSNTTAAVEITVIVWPAVPSSNIVRVCELACVLKRFPVDTDGVVSEALNVTNVPDGPLNEAAPATLRAPSRSPGPEPNPLPPPNGIY